jgi:hypothetical protein
MVTLEGSLVMGSHPEFMRAGLKAFRSMEELKDDISELYKSFPPGKGRAWVAVSEAGDLYVSDFLDNQFDTDTLKKNAKEIYSLSGDRLPNTHKYHPFMKSRLDTTFNIYRDWISVTREYLMEKEIPLTMEEKPHKVYSLHLGSSLSKSVGKKRKMDVDESHPRKAPMKFKRCTNTNCMEYSLLHQVPCATKKCNYCKMVSLI